MVGRAWIILHSYKNQVSPVSSDSFIALSLQGFVLQISIHTQLSIFVLLRSSIYLSSNPKCFSPRLPWRPFWPSPLSPVHSPAPNNTDGTLRPARHLQTPMPNSKPSPLERFQKTFPSAQRLSISIYLSATDANPTKPSIG